jgi:hypothetical protein
MIGVTTQIKKFLATKENVFFNVNNPWLKVVKIGWCVMEQHALITLTIV